MAPKFEAAGSGGALCAPRLLAERARTGQSGRVEVAGFIPLDEALEPVRVVFQSRNVEFRREELRVTTPPSSDVRVAAHVECVSGNTDGEVFPGKTVRHKGKRRVPPL